MVTVYQLWIVFSLVVVLFTILAWVLYTVDSRLRQVSQAVCELEETVAYLVRIKREDEERQTSRVGMHTVPTLWVLD